MFRRATTLLGRPLLAARARRFSTDLPAAPTADSQFVEAWNKVVPNLDPPRTPLAFMTPRPATPSSIPSKLTVNFMLPYSSEKSGKEVGFEIELLRRIFALADLLEDKEKAWNRGLIFSFDVDMVIIPATTGQMGVLPGHVATIAELKPGILSVHSENEVTKYFVSSGFAFIHANSVADIVAVEAVPVDQIDSSLVQKGLQEFTQKLNSATTDLEKAEAQIGIDVHSALNAALSG
ncbi:hypothetical protein QN277_022953 [Acacia crassicarpa]|uniref:ATP synthase F1 complex delta/epsilon subunit N-terminal domain-containing protein n=1 Tax=Acacia crassicarpa TaxID=499986 RepID=A0AAE1JFZ9_9FABA|nr:hypothetical protein QN277_022953 [Acacia crassicarpa]